MFVYYYIIIKIQEYDCLFIIIIFLLFTFKCSKFYDFVKADIIIYQVFCLKTTVRISIFYVRPKTMFSLTVAQVCQMVGHPLSRDPTNQFSDSLWGPQAIELSYQAQANGKEVSLLARVLSCYTHCIFFLFILI